MRHQRITQADRQHTARGVLIALLLILLPACTLPEALPTRPNRVAIAVDGERQLIETHAESVAAVLEEVDVTLGDLDRVRPPETARIENGQIITVTRVRQSEEVITQTLPFERETVRNASLPEGESRLLQAGQEGVREQVYALTLEDGVEAKRVLVRDEIVEPPQDEVLLVGTRPRITTTSITRTLAYLEHQDVWIMRGSTANPRRLTSFGDLDGRIFTLSADGTQLIFTRAVTDPAHINALWFVPTEGAEIEAVDTELRDVLWADWTPDGRYLTWTTAEVVDRAPGWRGRNDLLMATITSRGSVGYQRTILEPEAAGGFGWWGTRYHWGPEKEQLAYARPEEIGTVDIDEQERQTLFTYPAYRTYSSWAWVPEVSWSPGGAFLATVGHGPAPNAVEPEESPVFDLWVVEATGAFSAELASEVGMWAAPQFSPDGETLLFGRARIPYQSHLSNYTLCMMDRDGSNTQCLYPPEDETGIEIPVWQWSPDSKSVAFIFRDDLHILHRADATPIPITDEGGVTAVDWR